MHLSRDRAAALSNPLVHERLNGAEDRRILFEAPRRIDVEVEVAVAEVAEAGDQSAEGREALAHHVAQVVELSQRDGDVVPGHAGKESQWQSVAISGNRGQPRAPPEGWRRSHLYTAPDLDSAPVMPSRTRQMPCDCA